MIGWFDTPGGPSFPELVQQGLSSIEGGYDRLSAKFDQSVFRTPDAVLDGLEGQFFRCRRALDIGCGTGAVLHRLQGYAEEVTGVDLSRNMLARARLQVGPEPALFQGDFLKFYWEDHFDLITSVGVLGHIRPQDQCEFFRRVYRALRPGGMFLSVLGDLRGRPWVYLPALAFDSLMRIRNFVWRPTFVMYYLSFVLPRAQRVLEQQGFACQVLDGRFPMPFRQLKVLLARKPYLSATDDAVRADANRSGPFRPD
ncbi:MAG: methyltransferase domain-containing protein [Candidatus Eremiobacteraeota bacterium]|nr:methyltransferase domain-containing protein [Candidatus Eremiobacteraeota bacterium]